MLLKCQLCMIRKLINLIALLLLLILLINVNVLNNLYGKLLVRLLIVLLVLFVMALAGLKKNGTKVISVPMIPARINVVVLLRIWIEVVLLQILNSRQYYVKAYHYRRLNCWKAYSRMFKWFKSFLTADEAFFKWNQFMDNHKAEPCSLVSLKRSLFYGDHE